MQFHKTCGHNTHLLSGVTITGSRCDFGKCREPSQHPDEIHEIQYQVLENGLYDYLYLFTVYF